MVANAAPIRSVPPEAIATGQVQVTTGATLIVAAREERRGILIINSDAVVLFLGNSDVTTTTGLRILGVSGTGIVIPSAQAIYGIVDSGTTNVSFMELF